MEPNHNNISFPELPMPQDEAGHEQGDKTVPSPEIQGVQPATPASTGTNNLGLSPALGLPLQPATQGIQPLAQGTGATPAIADDADLIEKEWVTKAKAIVAATKDDPYTQNREMNQVRADYMKKRYNKDIKISEA